MYKYYMFLLLTFIATIMGEEKSEVYKTNDNVIVWYPIPINVGTLEQTLNNGKQSPLVFNALTFLSKLKNLHNAAEEKQITVTDKTDDDTENAAKSALLPPTLKIDRNPLIRLLPTNKISSYNSSSNYPTIHEHDIHDYTKKDKIIAENSRNNNLPQTAYIDDENTTMIYVNTSGKNVNNQSRNDENEDKSIAISPSDAQIHERDSPKSLNGDLPSNKSVSSENSNINDFNNEYQKSGNHSKVITFKITILNEDSNSTLGQPNSDSLENSQNVTTIKSIRNFATPLVAAVIEANKDKGNVLPENAKVELILEDGAAVSKDTLKVPDLEKINSHNAKIQFPLIDQEDDKSEIQYKFRDSSDYPLDDSPDYHEDIFKNFEILGGEQGDESNTESLDDVTERNLSEAEFSNSAAKHNSNRNEKAHKSPETNKDETEVYETSEKETKITGTNEKGSQTSETNADKTQTTETKEEAMGKVTLDEDNKNLETIVPKIISVSETNTGKPVVVSGRSIEKKEEPLVIKNVNTDLYSNTNGSLQSSIPSDVINRPSKQTDTSCHDFSVFMNQYLLKLNKNIADVNSELSNTELDQFIPNETPWKCVINVLKVLLQNFIQRKLNCTETRDLEKSEASGQD